MLCVEVCVILIKRTMKLLSKACLKMELNTLLLG